jgi:hypothetical protein
MEPFRLILLALAVAFELLATFLYPRDERWNLVAAGLVCFFISLMLPR